MIMMLVSCIAFIPTSLKGSFSSIRMQAKPEEWLKRKGVWDTKDLSPLLEANKAWAARTAAANPAFFGNMKNMPHAPKILWLGCADARVPANEIIGEEPGSVFVHRNIANNVIATDFSSMSVLQYAVDYLKVRHVVVCGHYDCGGVKAALSAYDHKAPLENWLKNIRDVARIHEKELSGISDITAKQNRLVELNAKEQALNMLKTATVQKRREETRFAIEQGSTEFAFVEPQVHAFVYEPRTGLAKKIPLGVADDASDAAELKAYKMYEKTTALAVVPKDATTAPAAAADRKKELELDFKLFTLRLFSQ